MRRYQHSGILGVSIIEILLAVAVFSVAVVGLFVAMSAINKGIGVSMRRDIEGAYANMLMSKVNPYDQDVETAYDVTSTGCAGSRCYIDIPNSYNPGNGVPVYERAYYTILVKSDSNTVTFEPATADVRLINLYFFRDATTTTPYRQFKREFAPDVVGWKLGGGSTFYRDITGLLWSKMSTSTNYSTTAGSVKAGIDTTDTPTGLLTAVTLVDPTNLPVVGGVVVDKELWMSAVEPAGGGTKFGFDFPATEYRRYVVEIGFNEFDSAVTTAAQRVFDIYINDAVVESSLDIYSAAGGKNKAITKSYTVVPTTVSSVPTIKIRLQQNGGVAARLPRACWIRIRRT